MMTQTKKPNYRIPGIIWSACLTLALLAGCGGNPFESYESKDPAEDATVALEEGNPDKAISILTSALRGDPQNNVYISILALAYAERAGVDPLSLAQNMASGSGSSSSTSGNGVTSLFSIMPAATDANIADVDQAVTLMLSIPNEARTTADTLKLAMFQTAALTLRSKKYDINGDGVVSASELLSMSSSDALTILSQLDGAASAFTGGTSTSTVDQAASTQVTAIKTKISTCPGANSEEQLKNYLSKTGC